MFDSPAQALDLTVQMMTPAAIVVAGYFAVRAWIRHSGEERELRIRQIKIEEAREEKRRADEDSRRYDEREREAERLAVASAGPTGSGGYIVVDMAEQQRPLFHDLLKGFEDYAKLKGYDLSFSIDSSLTGRIAFKFTVKNEGFVVGAERVRQDFREYLEHVHDANPDRLDDLPIITSVEEHNLLVTMLKNRLVFLHHSYQLSQNAVKFYEGLIGNVRTFPALPAPSVIVHTGGAMDSRSYSANHSERLIQGDSNVYQDSSINIGGSFNERQERVAAIDDVMSRLRQVENPGPPVAKAVKGLSNAKDELTEHREPDRSSVKKWLEYAKDALKTAALGADVNTAAQKLFALFEMTL